MWSRRSNHWTFLEVKESRDQQLRPDYFSKKNRKNRRARSSICRAVHNILPSKAYLLYPSMGGGPQLSSFPLKLFSLCSNICIYIFSYLFISFFLSRSKSDAFRLVHQLSTGPCRVKCLSNQLALVCRRSFFFNFTSQALLSSTLYW